MDWIQFARSLRGTAQTVSIAFRAAFVIPSPAYNAVSTPMISAAREPEIALKWIRLPSDGKFLITEFSTDCCLLGSPCRT